MTTPANGIEAVTTVRRLALAAGVAGALRAAAQLQIADALGDKPRTPSELARPVNADPDTLGRLLRALAANGVFTAHPDGTYSHNPVSQLLRDDHPRSLRYMVMWATEPWTWTVWPQLSDAVQVGKGVFRDLHGKDFFTFLHEDAPDSADVFNKAMTQASKLSADAIAKDLDLRGDLVVADIAGGHGELLTTVLERDPALRGVLFDLPEVLVDADPRLLGGGSLAARAGLVGGDCRSEVPVTADVYILKNVLEWDDDSTVQALRNVAANARAGARVLIIENLVDDTPETSYTALMDLLLLLNVGGRKHTRNKLVGLAIDAELEVAGVRPIGPFLHLVDCRVRG